VASATVALAISGRPITKAPPEAVSLDAAQGPGGMPVERRAGYRPRGLPCRHGRCGGIARNRRANRRLKACVFNSVQHTGPAAIRGSLLGRGPGLFAGADPPPGWAAGQRNPRFPVTTSVGAAPGDAAQRPSRRRAGVRTGGRAERRGSRGHQALAWSSGSSSGSARGHQPRSGGRFCSLSRARFAGPPSGQQREAIPGILGQLQGLGAIEAVEPRHTDRFHQRWPAICWACQGLPSNPIDSQRTRGRAGASFAH